MPPVRKIAPVSPATLGKAAKAKPVAPGPDDYRAELPPSSFDIAAARAMARHSRDQWALLEPAKRTQAIYAELRRVDAGFTTALAAE